MTSKTGLLLVNLGSPDEPTAKSVRKYLFEFLHDKRVIETTRWIWCPILHGIILRTRPARSARNYKKIWTLMGGKDGDEAPLVRITRAQAAGVAKHFGDDVQVDIAMRYGNPSVPSAIDKMMAQGITRIAVLPLYPQYAGATTASVYDAVQKTLKNRRDVPSLRILRDYHDHPEYIRLLADSVEKGLAEAGVAPDVILASFHGMPQSYVDKGDPYASECETTTKLLKDALGSLGEKLRLTYQSRFGPMKWLQPYTDITLEGFPEQGVTSVAVLTPGFSADCLETLEEINMEARESFMEAGGKEFTYIPCLNDAPGHVEFLANLSKNELLSDWLDSE